MKETIAEKFEPLYYKRNNVPDNKFKWTYKNLIIYLAICYLLSLALTNIFPFWAQSFGTSLGGIYFIAVLYGPLLYALLLACFMVILVLITFSRTYYTGYIKELLILLQEIIMILLIFYFSLIEPNILYFVVLLFTFSSITALGYSLLKKPLFWDRFSLEKQLMYNDQKTDIILNQARHISEHEDGYSARPIVVDFSDIISQINDEKLVIEKTIDLGTFLAERGYLIGYDYKNNQVKMFLRTSLLQKSDLLRPILFFKRYLNVVKKKDLTVVIFDFHAKELYFKLNRNDYLLLDNITYHSLGNRLLKNFKTSLKYYLADDFDNCENILLNKPKII